MKTIKKYFSITVHYCLALFICLFALFMSHEQCKRRWVEKKKKRKKKHKRKRRKCQSKQTLYVVLVNTVMCLNLIVKLNILYLWNYTKVSRFFFWEIKKKNVKLKYNFINISFCLGESLYSHLVNQGWFRKKYIIGLGSSFKRPWWTCYKIGNLVHDLWDVKKQNFSFDK